MSLQKASVLKFLKLRVVMVGGTDFGRFRGNLQDAKKWLPIVVWRTLLCLMRFLFDVRITSISYSVVSVTLVEEINWIRFSKEHNSLRIRHSGSVGESMSQLRSPSIMMSFPSFNFHCLFIRQSYFWNYKIWNFCLGVWLVFDWRCKWKKHLNFLIATRLSKKTNPKKEW